MLVICQHCNGSGRVKGDDLGAKEPRRLWTKHHDTAMVMALADEPWSKIRAELRSQGLTLDRVSAILFQVRSRMQRA